MRKMDLMLLGLKAKSMKMLQKKVEGIDGFIVAIIIIVIAIAVGLVFKTQISNFITNFFAQFATQTQALF